MANLGVSSPLQFFNHILCYAQTALIIAINVCLLIIGFLSIPSLFRNGITSIHPKVGAEIYE